MILPGESKDMFAQSCWHEGDGLAQEHCGGGRGGGGGLERDKMGCAHLQRRRGKWRCGAHLQIGGVVGFGGGGGEGGSDGVRARGGVLC